MACNWSALPEELLEGVTEHLGSLRDRVCFAAVCRTWRSALAGNERRRPILRTYLPYVVLTDQHQEPEAWLSTSNDRTLGSSGGGGGLCLLDLSDGKVRRGLMLLPELSSGWTSFGACFSWLGMMEESGSAACLLDPFIGDVVGLPPLGGFGGGAGSPSESWFPVKMCLSSPNPASDPGCIAVVIRSYRRGLAYALPGSRRPWVPLDHPRTKGYRDVVYHRGAFYAICERGNDVIVVAFDVVVGGGSRGGGGLDGPRLGDGRLVARLPRWYASLYLAVLPDRGDLVFVSTDVDCCGNAVGNRVVEVGKIEAVPPGTEPVESLGDCAVFLGCSCSMSIRTSQVAGGWCRENTIYFADGCKVPYGPLAWGHGVEICCLDDGRKERLYPMKQNPSLTPPVWMVPRIVKA